MNLEGGAHDIAKASDEIFLYNSNLKNDYYYLFYWSKIWKKPSCPRLLRILLTARWFGFEIGENGLT